MGCWQEISFFTAKLLKYTFLDRKYFLLILSVTGIISIQLIYFTAPVSVSCINLYNLFDSVNNIADSSRITGDSYNPVQCHKCSVDNYESDALDPRNWIPQKPFVYYRAFGGLGNQLFQYACAYTIAKKNKIPLLVYADPKPGSDVPGFQLNHGDFALHLYGIPLPRYNYEKTGLIDSYIENANNLSLLQSLSDATILSQSYQITDKIYNLNDYCQSEWFFRPYSQEIVKFYKPKDLSRTLEWMQMIRNGQDDEAMDSVSIHVRLGDYKLTESRLVNASFYIAAMNEIRHRLKPTGRIPKFYIFSDEIDEVKDTFNQIISPEDYEKLMWVSDRNKTLVEDLYLMSQCRHNIISGSSFGWWGAYLNEYPDKIVIAAHFKASLFSNDPFHAFLFRHVYYPVEWFVKEAEFVN